MDGFLEEIVGMDDYKSNVTEYNYNFFEKYVDKNVLYDLLDLCHLYVSTLDLITRRNQNWKNEQLLDLAFNVEQVESQIDDIIDSQRILCEKKRNAAVSRSSVYLATSWGESGEGIEPTTDFDHIAELTQRDLQISEELEKNDIILKQLLEQLFDRQQAYNKAKGYIGGLNDKILQNFELIQNLFISLDGKDRSVFNIDIEQIKEEYSAGLVDVLPNTKAREMYMTYLFDSLEREISSVEQTYGVAKQFISSAEEETNFVVPELQAQNNKIACTYDITQSMQDNVKQFVGVGCKGATDENLLVTEVSEEYLRVKPYVDDIYSYIDNLEIYEKDPGLSKIHYLNIFDVANDSCNKRSNKDFLRNMPHILVVNLFGPFNKSVQTIRKQQSELSEKNVAAITK